MRKSELEFLEPGKVDSLCSKVPGFCVFPDVSPVFLQLDLDRKFQLQDIMMDFKVCFLGMAVDKRGGTLGHVGLDSWGAQGPCLLRLEVMVPHVGWVSLPQVGA